MWKIIDNLETYAKMNAEEVMEVVGLSSDGLKDEAVLKQQNLYGNNELGNVYKDTFCHHLRRAFINPFSTILLALAIIFLVTGKYIESAASYYHINVGLIVVLLLVSGGIRLFEELRAGMAAGALNARIQTTITVRRNGIEQEIATEDLVVGDLVVLRSGERVPADCRLIRAQDFFVSQALLTGESHILEKTSAEIFDLPQNLLNCKNMIFMGSHVIGGNAEAVVLKIGKETVYGQYFQSIQKRKKGFDEGANSIAWVLVRFILALVPLVFILSAFKQNSLLLSFLFALSVAVGLVPELLPMVVNACLAKGNIAMGNKETIVKNINAMQKFGSMDILCVDKTGTLTGDQEVVEYYLDILGHESMKVLNYAYLNAHAHSGIENHLDKAILACHPMPNKVNHFKELRDGYTKLDEIPFDYSRKCVSILFKQNDHTNILITKGSVSEVYARCSFIDYQGMQQSISPDDWQSVAVVVDEMVEDGMKVLAVAYKKMGNASHISTTDEEDLVLLGYLVFFDTPKKSAAESLEKLRALHLQVKVLTGDQKDVTLSVCRRLGIDTKHVLTGADIAHLSEEQLSAAVESHHVFAELLPKQKADIIDILHNNGHTVGFLGDGMNDLSAMIAADVGISVDTAVDAVKETADVILLKKELNVLEQGVFEGRKAFANMSKYIRITASSNFGNIFAIVLASTFLPFLPMTAIQLLLLNLIYDTLCMTLPWDHVDEDIYRKPQIWSGKTLGRFMRFFGPLSSIFDLMTFAFLYFVLCPFMLGDMFPNLSPEAQHTYVVLFHTGWFLESLWSQVIIIHMLRTKHVPLIQSRASRIVCLVTTLGLFIFTFIVYTPAAGWLGLSALPLWYFIFLVLVLLMYMTVVTFAKRQYIKKHQDLL